MTIGTKNAKIAKDTKGHPRYPDTHSGVSGVSQDQKFCEDFKNTHCQVDHPAKIE